MTGIIVEIKGKKMVVMNDRGDFQKLKYQEGYQIGQEIELDGLVGLSGAALVQRTIAAAALFLIIAGIGLYTYYTPYSYVNLDINPSIEIVLNMYDRVLDVQGINREGQIIVEANGEFMHDNVGNTISRLIRQAYDANYLKQDEENEIMITISAPKPKVIEGIRDEVQYHANKELEKSNITSNVAVEGVTIEKHLLAKKEHISTGKLLLMEQLQEKSPETSVEQVKGKSVKEIKEYIKKEEDKNKKREKVDNTETPQSSKSRDDVPGDGKEENKEKIEQKDKKDRNNNKYENKDKIEENNKNNNKYNSNNNNGHNNNNNNNKKSNKDDNNNKSKNNNPNNSNNGNKNKNDNRDNNENKNNNPTPDKKDEDKKEKEQEKKEVDKYKEKSRIQDDVYEPNSEGLKKKDEKKEDNNNKRINESVKDLKEQQSKD